MGNESVAMSSLGHEALAVKREQTTQPIHTRETATTHAAAAERTDSSDASARSHDELLSDIAHNPVCVTEIVNARPTEVGELLQRAIASGRPDVVQVLSGAMKAAYTTGSNSELVWRSVLRVDGPGSREVRDVMRSFVLSRQIAASRLPGAKPLKDPRLAALDAADRDPATARFKADFFDRPDSAAKQLVAEAQNDPAMLSKRRAALDFLMLESPAAGQSFAESVMRVKGPGARDANLQVLASADAAMGTIQHTLALGDGTQLDGLESAGGITAVTIAELVTNPENARALIALQRRDKAIPGTRLGIRGALSRALSSNLPISSRRQVLQLIGEGAAGMFRDAVTAPSGVQRGRSLDAARFIGIAACAEKRQPSYSDAEAAGQLTAVLVEHLGKYVPIPGAGQAAKYGGDVLRSASRPTQQLNSVAIRNVLRDMYDALHPVPLTNNEEIREEYESELAAWQGDVNAELAEQQRECE